MEYSIPYGKGMVPITIPDSIQQVELSLPNQSVIENPEEILISTFEQPIQSKSLELLLKSKKPNSITIVVDDQTRKFPHKLILVPLLHYLEERGVSKKLITILVATGVHKRPTLDQLEYLFGSTIINNYLITFNDQENGKFMDYGVTSRGTPVKINRVYADADLKLLITDVTLHYFAGFGGDRKSIFPGVASSDSINKNHALVMQGIYPGQIEQNPIHDDMMEAAQLAGADFVINVSLDSEGNVLDIKSGGLKHAFLEAVKNYQKTCTVSIQEQCDLLLLSAGGHPFDSNYQQSMKAVMQCQSAMKPGGKVLYFLKGEQGIGIAAFKNYLDQFPNSRDILEHTQTHEYKQGMHNAYYYRKFTEDHKVWYYTELPKQYVEDTLNVNFVEDVQTTLENLLQDVKSVYIIRHGTKMMIQHTS